MWGHGRGEQEDLDVLGKVLEDLINVFLESSPKHFVGFVQTEKLEIVDFEKLLVHHVKHSTRGSHHDMRHILQGSLFGANIGATS